MRERLTIMAIELTGPDNCAECGTEITTATLMADDAGPLVLDIKGHKIEVPGLYVCTPCAGAVMTGERETGVTYEAARDYLRDNFAPKVATFIEITDDPIEIMIAVSRLNDTLEMAKLLHALVELSKDEGGLDFIPECDGRCGCPAPEADEEPNPRDMAAMN